MIECIRYSPVNKNSCLGVATVLVEKWGVEISGISLHEKNGKRWINLPARIVSAEEGAVDQKSKYYPYIKFVKSDHKHRFCEIVKKAIDIFQEKIYQKNEAQSDINKEEFSF